MLRRGRCRGKHVFNKKILPGQLPRLQENVVKAHLFLDISPGSSVRGGRLPCKQTHGAASAPRAG